MNFTRKLAHTCRNIHHQPLTIILITVSSFGDRSSWVVVIKKCHHIENTNKVNSFINMLKSPLLYL